MKKGDVSGFEEEDEEDAQPFRPRPFASVFQQLPPGEDGAIQQHEIEEKMPQNAPSAPNEKFQDIHRSVTTIV